MVLELLFRVALEALSLIFFPCSSLAFLKDYNSAVYLRSFSHQSCALLSSVHARLFKNFEKSGNLSSFMKTIHFRYKNDCVEFLLSSKLLYKLPFL